MNHQPTGTIKPRLWRSDVIKSSGRPLITWLSQEFHKFFFHFLNRAYIDCTIWKRWLAGEISSSVQILSRERISTGKFWHFCTFIYANTAIDRSLKRPPTFNSFEVNVTHIHRQLRSSWYYSNVFSNRVFYILGMFNSITNYYFSIRFVILLWFDLQITFTNDFHLQNILFADQKLL